MKKRTQPAIVPAQAGVNPGYAASQIAKAHVTSTEHTDAATRERAREKLARWESILTNILTGAAAYGTRTPIKGVPAWATLEVLTGGFATGQLLAEGPLQEHEQCLLGTLPHAPQDTPRHALNTYFLTAAGLAQLQDWLETGCYDIAVPEEGALLVVAWLLDNGYAQAARELLEVLSPYFSRLRFYPIPLTQPRQFGAQVHIQTVRDTITALQKLKPNQRILAQQEAVGVWIPLHDRIVALFLETIEDGWPCQTYPDGWAQRAQAVLDAYANQRRTHQLCGKPERANGYQAQLREFLQRCVRDPRELSGREVGRIRLILNRYLEKHGAPDSQRCVAARQQQAAAISAPTFHTIAPVVILRLKQHLPDTGLDDIQSLQQPVSAEEAAHTGVSVGTLIPPSIQRKIERCHNETVQVLVKRGLLTSGEAIARVLPQITSGLRAASITDPLLQQLYAALYRAFRRRRSLLLLNLGKQVAIEELPWVAAIDRFRSETLAEQALARQTLEDMVVLTLTAFPHVILPNKLLQELQALAKAAALDIPLVNEVAADIFMGVFTGKFIAAAKQAADLLEGTLYATYYAINYAEVRDLPTEELKPFAQLCAARAGVSLGTYDPATNGMIIEQQQILTTHNLAPLFMNLTLTPALSEQLVALSQQCFAWICRRQQMKITRWHARLIMVKNTAYAWRQMVFFLALVSEPQLTDFLVWAEAHLNAQSEVFQTRFRPVLTGLLMVAQGTAPESPPVARRLLGWAKQTHWLLAADLD